MNYNPGIRLCWDWYFYCHHLDEPRPIKVWINERVRKEILHFNIKQLSTPSHSVWWAETWPWAPVLKEASSSFILRSVPIMPPSRLNTTIHKSVRKDNPSKRSPRPTQEHISSFSISSNNTPQEHITSSFWWGFPAVSSNVTRWFAMNMAMFQQGNRVAEDEVTVTFDVTVP